MVGNFLPTLGVDSKQQSGFPSLLGADSMQIYVLTIRFYPSFHCLELTPSNLRYWSLCLLSTLSVSCNVFLRTLCSFRDPHKYVRTNVPTYNQNAKKKKKCKSPSSKDQLIHIRCHFLHKEAPESKKKNHRNCFYFFFYAQPFRCWKFKHEQ